MRKRKRLWKKPVPGKSGHFLKEASTEGILCHGDYNQHHVLLSREGTALTDFGHCHFGVRTGDLARFFRKILEKTELG